MAPLSQTFMLVSAVSLSFPLTAYTHMEMSWPYPFRSKFDHTITNPNYDNISPLNSDGSNYPCKGFQNLPSSQRSKITYTPGQKYNISISGTATHMGGSCQISLSYNNGQNFKVIKSMIGGCPLKANWDFTVPSNAPASDGAMLAWTWFNIVGNREMYMNCARVTIAGQSVQRYRRYETKRQSSFNDLPDSFVCNIGNGCKTIERREVTFSNPGPEVEKNTDLLTPDTGPGFTLTGTPNGTAFSPAESVTTPTTTTTLDLDGNGTSRTFMGSFETGFSDPIFSNSSSLLTVTSSATIDALDVVTTSSETAPTITPSSTIDSRDAGGLVPENVTVSHITTTAFLESSTPKTLVDDISTEGILTSTADLLTAPSGPFTNLTTSLAMSTTFILPITTITTDSISTEGAPMASESAESNCTFDHSSSMIAPLTIESTTDTPASTSAISQPDSPLTLDATSTTATTTFSTVTIPMTSPAPASSIIPTTCSPGSFTCNSPTTFSQCVADSSGSGTYVFVGSVAPGTQCSNGSITRQNAGSCTPNGSLQCNGESAFYMCDQGGLISMGPVAPGTACRNGAIVIA